MKHLLVTLSFVVCFASCLGNLEDLQAYCSTPVGLRNIIVDCMAENFDEATKEAVRQVEECAGITFVTLMKEMCDMQDLTPLRRFVECDNQIGFQDPKININEAETCVRRKLEITKE